MVISCGEWCGEWCGDEPCGHVENRDEFGNIAFPDESYFTVDVDGCSLNASDLTKFAETVCALLYLIFPPDQLTLLNQDRLPVG